MCVPVRSVCVAVWLSFLVAPGAEASRLIAGHVLSTPTGRVTSLYEVDPTTGAAQWLAPLPQRLGWWDLASRSDDPNSVYAASRTTGSTYQAAVSRIDLATGAVTDLYSFLPEDFGYAPSTPFFLLGISIPASHPSSATILGNVDIDPSSNLVFVTILFDLDLDTGARSPVRVVSGLSTSQRLAVAPDGSLYTVKQETPRRLGVIDPTTAVSTEIGTCGACYIRSLDFDPATGKLFGFSGYELLEVSPIDASTLRDIGPTGLPATSGSTISSLWGMAFVVPEPDTAVLLAFGLGALGWRRRGRRPRAS